jgi:hypothetical protein
MMVSPGIDRLLFPPSSGQHRKWKIPIVNSANLIFAEIGGKAPHRPCNSLVWAAK